MDWADDPKQDAIIGAEPGVRLLVGAGPGTGKTAVACRRVAALIRKGIESENIWLISFTRTAVREIKDRINALVADDSRARAVKITTLDSQAWHLREGFDTEKDRGVFDSYDQNIDGVVALLNSGKQEVEEFLGSVEHLVVDEAQDLVGRRAQLVLELIRAIPAECGVTVFSDDAQAIYGFTSDENGGEIGIGSETLPILLRKMPELRFREVELDRIHRTKSPGLKRIFTHTRGVVLGGVIRGASLQEKVREAVEMHADGRVGNVERQGLAGRDDTLVLFRKRAEVLLASSFLSECGVRHRIRMSGVPARLLPWLGIAFWDAVENLIKRGRFEKIWSDRIEGRDAGILGCDDAWRLIHEVAGETRERVDLRKLRAILARIKPPIAFCSPDLGDGGPIIGTIHASKGREAPRVHLMLPGIRAGGTNLDEEARVLFVGATRAREHLGIGSGYDAYTNQPQWFGRIYHFGSPAKSPRAQVEIGREGDLLDVFHVDRRFVQEAQARSTQSYLAGVCTSLFKAVASRAPGAPPGATYKLFTAEAGSNPNLIGGLDQVFNRDLSRIGDRLLEIGRSRRRLYPRAEIRHISVFGARTVSIASDSPLLETLHAPFSESGFFLAPVPVTYSMVYFA